MHTRSYTEIDGATKKDVDQVALLCLGGQTLAIEDDVYECIRVANSCGANVKQSDVHIDTDPIFLTTESLVAVRVRQ